MEFVVMAVLFFVIMVPLVLGILIPLCRDHRKAGGGVVNCDAMMRRFVYRVELSREEIIRLLKAGNDADELRCAFDAERDVVEISEYGSSVLYHYEIRECDGFCVLRLEQAALISVSSLVPFKLNPFIVSRLQAEPLPYAQYGG